MINDIILNPKFIILYDEKSCKEFNIEEIFQYLKRKTSKSIEKRPDFFDNILSKNFQSKKENMIDFLSKKMASLRVSNIERLHEETEPLLQEIRFEIKNIKETSKKISGLLYEGFKLQSFFHELIPEKERNLNYLHVIFTNQLIVTWDYRDRRYHLRTSVYGFPSIISLTGIVEAPAKPREYYILKQALYNEDRMKELKERFKGRFIDYGDPAINEIVKGYVMQALFYYLLGNPFCKNRHCRLFNAHWQEEMIECQLKSPTEFCSFHEKILNHF
ncbi:MAG: DUF6775 family putative metallopeptidase [Acidobacteriota bacterium]